MALSLAPSSARAAPRAQLRASPRLAAAPLPLAPRRARRSSFAPPILSLARPAAAPSAAGAQEGGEGPRRAVAWPLALPEVARLPLLLRLRTAAVSLGVALALSMTLTPAAHAARSSGRMGGSSFSSRSSSSSFGGGSSFRSGGSFSSTFAAGSSSGARSLASSRSSSVHLHTSSPLAHSSFFFMPFGGYYGGGGGGGATFVLLFALALIAAASLQQQREISAGGLELGGDKVAVVRLQVGLLGLARSLQVELDDISAKADTSTPSGLHYVLTETVLALLRHPEYAVYGASGSATRDGPAAAEAKFNELSLEERGKVAAETVVNVGGRRRRAALAGPPAADGGRNEFLVVTILVAADAPLKLPPVTSLAELSTALKRLGAVPRSALQAVEVLWTPSEEGDVLTQAELSAAYPLLNSL